MKNKVLSLDAFNDCFMSGITLLKNLEVHVWRGLKDFRSRNPACLEDVLSAEEKQKAQRYYFPEDRLEYVAAHYMLRTVLGEYLCVAPELLEFSANEYGKPSLASGFKASDMRFNMSHSSGLCLIAFANGMDLGVDVERINEHFDFMEIAEIYFSKEERGELKSLDAIARTAAFFNCWTRKEAYLKAVGKGLSADTGSIRVPMFRDEPLEIIDLSEMKNDTENWRLSDIKPAEGYAGALVTKGSPVYIKYFDFSFGQKRPQIRI